MVALVLLPPLLQICLEVILLFAASFVAVFVLVGGAAVKETIRLLIDALFGSIIVFSCCS